MSAIKIETFSSRDSEDDESRSRSPRFGPYDHEAAEATHLRLCAIYMKDGEGGKVQGDSLKCRLCAEAGYSRNVVRRWEYESSVELRQSLQSHSTICSKSERQIKAEGAEYENLPSNKPAKEKKAICPACLRPVADDDEALKAHGAWGRKECWKHDDFPSHLKEQIAQEMQRLKGSNKEEKAEHDEEYGNCGSCGKKDGWKGNWWNEDSWKGGNWGSSYGRWSDSSYGCWEGYSNWSGSSRGWNDDSGKWRQIWSEDGKTMEGWAFMKG